MDIAPTWKTAIRRLRGTKTQREVAIALGYKDETWVSRFEKGSPTTREWLTTRIEEVAVAYNVTVEELRGAAGLVPGPAPWHEGFPGVMRDEVEIPVPLDGVPAGWPRTAPEIGARVKGNGFVWMVGAPGSGRATAAEQLAKAMRGTVLAEEPPGGWAAFRSRTEGGRWVGVVPRLPSDAAKWIEEGELFDLRLQVAPWEGSDWRALLERLDRAGHVPAARLVSAGTLCDRLGAEQLPWDLGVRALRDHLDGGGHVPVDVWSAVLDTAQARAKALLPELEDDEVDAFWARRRLSCPGDGWDLLTRAEAEAALPRVPDTSALLDRVRRAKQGRKPREDLDELERALVHPASRREAWERAGLLREVSVPAPPVHPHTAALTVPTGTEPRLTVPQPGLALAWAARGLDASVRRGLSLDPSVLLDPSWPSVWEAIGRSGSRPDRWIAALDALDFPVEASRALVFLASTHPKLERFPETRLRSAWAEALLSSRLGYTIDTRIDRDRPLRHALRRLSERARDMLPVLPEDRAIEELLRLVRPGVDVDPHRLLPPLDSPDAKYLQTWAPGERWADQRSLVHDLAEAAPWQLPTVKALWEHSDRPPAEALLEHGARHGLVEAMGPLLWKAPAVAARYLTLLPEAERQKAFLTWWARATRADRDALLAVAPTIPGIERLVREAFLVGLTFVSLARRDGRPLNPRWRLPGEGDPIDPLVVPLARAVALSAGETRVRHRMTRILRNVVERRITLQPGLSRGVPMIGGEPVRDGLGAVSLQALTAAVTRRFVAVDTPRAEAAEALWALGEPDPLRARLDAPLDVGPRTRAALRRLHGWCRVLTTEPAGLFRGDPVSDDVTAFLAEADARSRSLKRILEEGRAYDERHPDTVPDPWWYIARWALPESIAEAFSLLDAVRAPPDARARTVRALLVVLANDSYWPLGEEVSTAVWHWLVGPSPEPDWLAGATAHARKRAATVLAESRDPDVLARWAMPNWPNSSDPVLEGVNDVLDRPERWEEAVALLPPGERRIRLLAQAFQHFLKDGERFPGWLKREAWAALPDWPVGLAYAKHPDVWPLVQAWLERTPNLSARVEKAMSYPHFAQLHNELVADAVLDWCEGVGDPFAPGEEGVFGPLPGIHEKVLEHVGSWLATGLAPEERLGTALARLWAIAVRLPLGSDNLPVRIWAPPLVDRLAGFLLRCGRVDVLLSTYRAPPPTTDADHEAITEQQEFLRPGPWPRPLWGPLLGLPSPGPLDRGSLLRLWLLDRVGDLLAPGERDWRVPDPLQEWRVERAWAAGDPDLVDEVCARAEKRPPGDPMAGSAWMRAAAARPEATFEALRARWKVDQDPAWVDLALEIDEIWGPWQARVRRWGRDLRGKGHPSGDGAV